MKNSSDVCKKTTNTNDFKLEHTGVRNKTSKLHKMCRICLSTDESDLFPLFLNRHDGLFLSDMFTFFTSIQMSIDDELPLCVCTNCRSSVIYCYKFKLKCKTSQNILKSIILNQDSIINLDNPKDLIHLKLVSLNDTSYDGILLENAKLGSNNKEENILKEEDDEILDAEYLEDGFSDEDNKLWIVQPTSNNNKKKVKNKDKERKVSRSQRYSCPICKEKFESASRVTKHMLVEHKSLETEYFCGFCKESFGSQHDLDIHTIVHKKGPWKCSQCDKEFRMRCRLRRHLHTHMQCKRYSCDACARTFAELCALRRHYRVHTGECMEKKYACTHCDKRFASEAALREHSAAHSERRSHACSACDKKFATARLLASHARTHSTSKPYACQYCSRRFRHTSSRSTHERTHTGERPFVCAACGKAFIQASNLTLHTRTHTGEKPYACGTCARRFASGSALRAHAARHAGPAPRAPCALCGKSLSRRSLARHVRAHAAALAHACRVCPARFRSAPALRDHRRVHTGEKPFECATCSQAFATRKQIITHIKGHQKKRNHKKEHQYIILPASFVCNKEGEILEEAIPSSEKEIILTQEVVEVAEEYVLQSNELGGFDQTIE